MFSKNEKKIKRVTIKIKNDNKAIKLQLLIIRLLILLLIFGFSLLLSLPLLLTLPLLLPLLLLLLLLSLLLTECSNDHALVLLIDISKSSLNRASRLNNRQCAWLKWLVERVLFIALSILSINRFSVRILCCRPNSCNIWLRRLLFILYLFIKKYRTKEASIIIIVKYLKEILITVIVLVHLID